jgi:hypothetical protein
MSQRVPSSASLALAAVMVSATACSAQTTPTTASPTDAAPAQAALTTPAAPASPIWNERARFLAGLPVPATSPLAKLQETQEWKDHRKALDSEWATLGERLERMKTWARAELDPRIDRTRPLVYFFGGPDAVAALTFFPEARSYLLAGLEPVGQVAPPEGVDAKVLDEALDGISYALRTAVRTSFFRTNEMGKDLTAKPKLEIRGVLPILLLFLARSEATVLDVERIEIDPTSGAPAIKAEGVAWGDGIPAVRITIQRAAAKAAQSLTYVRVDLGNDALAKTPGFMTFVRQYAPHNALLKAASFILHDNRFSTPRDFLLENAAAVLQEDSGVPFHFFKKTAWDYTCFGKYARPRPPFQNHVQADLSAACAAQPARPLTFVVGYRRGEDTNLFLGVKTVVEARTEPEPKSDPAPKGETAPRAAVQP